MATVIPFKSREKPEEKVYVCNCGNENFWLYQDGRIECTACNTFHEDMIGYWKLIDPTADKPA